MKETNSFRVDPMFYWEQGNKIYFSMGGKSFYITNDEFSTMKQNGLSQDNIISYTFEMLLNKKLADFSDMVPLFEDRFN
jgi:hypothetical protein